MVRLSLSLLGYFSNELSSIYPNVIFSKLLIPSSDGKGDISNEDDNFIKR